MNAIARLAKITITREVHDYLRSRKIFQRRSWTEVAVSPQGYIQRWKDGEEISVLEGAIVEEHSTFHAGAALHAAGSFCDIASALPLNTTMGRYCSIAPGCRMAGFRHPMEAVTGSHVVYRPGRESVRSYLRGVLEAGTPSPYRGAPIPQPQNEPLRIGNDVWIGDGVVLRGGISIGNGAVIAGHSVLTKSIPAYEIWGGNPARFIRRRFPEEIGAMLDASRWWDYELADLYALDLAHPRRFLKNFFQDPSRIRRFKPARYDVFGDLTALTGALD